MRGMAAFGVFVALGAGAAGCVKSTPDSGAPPAQPASAATAQSSVSRTPAESRTGATGSRSSADPAGDASATALAGTSWRVADAAAAAPSAESVPTLTFDSPEHVAGSTGCNRFSGKAALDGESLRLGPLATTRRGCPAPLMEQEKRFLQALEACRSWRRTEADGALELRDEAGAVLLRLAPAP